MDFKEFTNKMEQDLKAALEDVSPGVSVRQSPVEKLQGESYSALTVMPEGDNVGVNVNLDRLYAEMQAGKSYDEVLDEAADQMAEVLGDMPQWDVSQLSSYDRAKNQLCVEVVGIAGNEEMLNNIPHKEMENMALIYRMEVGKDERGAATMLVTNVLMDRFGVNQEQLHADAMQNSQVIRPAVLKSMAEVMAEMIGAPVEELQETGVPPMFVATNEEKTKGAAALFYPDFMDQAAKELGGDFYVLPSSVREVLLLPDDGMAKTAELSAMVSQINEAEVAPEERLSDSVYHYDADARVFELGEKFEARREALENEKNQRPSVLKELQNKVQDMDLKPKPAPHHTKAEPAL